MKINNIPEEFIQAIPILEKIEDNNYEAYFVGGSVRDTILNLPIHDVDIASSAYPEEIKAIFNKTVDTGIQHGTVMVLDHGSGYEITTFRTESGYQDYRRPDHVEFVRSLKDDIKRRDFTINALAMDKNGEIIDFYEGIDDLKNQLIKAVGDANQRFNEDALRMMRAIRFSSKLDFSIESKTFAAINEHSELLQKIAVERINVEFIKMMLGLKPSKGILNLIDSNLIKFTPFFNSYINKLKKLSSEKIDDNIIQSEIQVWSLLSYYLNLDNKEEHKMLKSYKCSNKMINDVVLSTNVVRKIILNSLSNQDVYNAGLDLTLQANQITKIFNENLSENYIKTLYDDLQIKQKSDLKIDGKDLIYLGIHPGPKIGSLISDIELKVINNELTNTFDDLINYVKNNFV
ncbi:CCA tRNA nucleotidyltransferase [Lactobacillus sp. S2-2]|uniref:CCA tRNA nucleotidyltransferase n=1 Tax=Lactobacillus sp. S2-2 TaxID=2692917 RepID=UPI001F0280C0|nr:CCA tRNA nucleotidyltransferase [Lactobacillus sp. S2-2]MCF6515025.1 CCA tRNA nucleotidyltransferase [Lactobacillus sp. S2-2]